MMRYRFIYKVVSLALDGRPRIEVEKTFHGDDDAFTGPSGPARVPASLLLELMAMTGGHLVFHHLVCRLLLEKKKIDRARTPRVYPTGAPPTPPGAHLRPPPPSISPG